MNSDVNSDEILHAIHKEVIDWRAWTGRVLVMVFAALAGLTVVAFTWMTELAFGTFEHVQQLYWWSPLLWTPLCTAAIVWVMRRYAIGSAGSGIPQVMAALDGNVSPANRSLFVSLKLTVAKMILATGGLLAGLSLGREGPSVQIAAGVMHHARRWLPDKSQVSEHGLMMAGGAAGIAAAFNTPLGGVMFAIEELSRKPEQRSSGLLLAAIVLSGLMAVSIYGNATYFGVIKVDNLSTALLLPGLAEALELARKYEPRMEGKVALDVDKKRKLRHAVEVRHESFMDEAFIALLRKYKVAVVVADTAGKWPYIEDVTADFMYLRLGSHKNNRYFRNFRVFFEFQHCSNTVHFRHHYIHKYQIGIHFFNFFKSFFFYIKE